MKASSYICLGFTIQAFVKQKDIFMKTVIEVDNLTLHNCRSWPILAIFSKRIRFQIIGGPHNMQLGFVCKPNFLVIETKCHLCAYRHI